MIVFRDDCIEVTFLGSVDQVPVHSMLSLAVQLTQCGILQVTVYHLKSYHKCTKVQRKFDAESFINKITVASYI